MIITETTILYDTNISQLRRVRKFVHQTLLSDLGLVGGHSSLRLLMN